MADYTTELSPTEIACGVTLEQVAELLPKGAFFSNGELWAMPRGTAPALAGAVARTAFGGPAEFSHINRTTGFLMYRRAEQ